MTRKIVTIPLSEAIVGHSGPITEIELRAPSLIDFFELGEPVTVGKSDDGAVIPIENDAAIKGYFERCVVSPAGADGLLLSQADLQDAMRIKEAILNFFATARQASRSPVSPTSSSSTSSS